MKLTTLTPGTMGLCGLAMEVFGHEAIVPSGWGTPVYLDLAGVSPEDQAAGLGLIKERALEFGVVISSKEVEL